MPKLLTPVQLASRLGVSERTVARMAGDGRLPKPYLIGGKPRYPEETIERFLRGAKEVAPDPGLSVETRYGAAYFEIVKAKYAVIDLGPTYAAFELKDGSLHLRPWFSYIVTISPTTNRCFSHAKTLTSLR